MSRDDWLRLGQLVRDRREELGLRQGAGGVSPATWRKVEGAIDPPYARRTLVGICRALGWATDSVDRILAGGEPVAVERPSRRTAEDVVDELAATIIEQREARRQWEQQMEAHLEAIDADIEAIADEAGMLDVLARVRDRIHGGMSEQAS